VRATRVLLAGAGKPDKFDAAEMRRLSGAALRYLKAKSIKNVAFALEPEFAETTSLQPQSKAPSWEISSLTATRRATTRNPSRCLAWPETRLVWMVLSSAGGFSQKHRISAATWSMSRPTG
jgi:hypothetical protein